MTLLGADSIFRKNKGLVFLTAVIFGGACLFVMQLFLHISPPEAEGVKLISQSITPEVIKDKSTIVEHLVQEGDAWGKILNKVGIGQELGETLLKKSQSVHNLASIRAGNEFRFVFALDTGDLQTVEYDIDDNEFLKIEKNPDGEFEVSREDIEYKINLVERSGTIENFLFEVAERQGIPDSVILELAWIFSWDIDFASSIRQGDSFALIYEDRFRDDERVKPGKILAARFYNDGREYYAFLYRNTQGYESYYDREGRELRRQFLRSPLDYKRITSGFSYNRFHPMLNTFTTHRAIDYAADIGTPVSATAAGTVNYVGWKGGNGQFIAVKHANSYETGYAHLSAYAKGIKVGAKVSQNQVIGFVGSTGLSTGPHLHYEMRKNGVLINPLSLELPPGKMLEGENLREFFKEKDRLVKLLSNASI